MPTFDSIANFVVPLAILLFFVILFFGKIKEPLGNFVRWIREQFEGKGGEIKDYVGPYDISYR